MMRDDSGQIHTIEGITAALILVVVLLFVTNSITFVAPQVEKSVDMNMSVMASDILTTTDVGDQNHISELKMDVLAWNNNSTIDPGTGIPGGEPGIASLDQSIGAYLPPYDNNNTQNKIIRYSVSFFYFDGANWVNRTVISHGSAYDNVMTASKIVTLNSNDDQLINKSLTSGMSRSAYWNNMVNAHQMPKVVEIRLSLWHA